MFFILLRRNIKISIITPSLNSEKYIRDCIDSVISQTYKNIEYIVVDGNSSDNTQSIVKTYGKKIATFISENDNGIFDAMNKGIKNATGDIIAILNSDDYYYDNKVIENIVSEFKNNDISGLYGDLIIISEDKKRIIRNWRSKKLNKKDWEKGLHPAHPTFFVKKEVYEKFGVFDEKYRIAADYELMLRFLYIKKIKSKYFKNKAPLVVMRAGGNSNKDIKAIIKSNKEVIESWKDNNLNPPKFLVVGKLYSKIKQFFFFPKKKLW